MKPKVCPRCHQSFADWQPIHLPCFLIRIRYWIIVPIAVALLFLFIGAAQAYGPMVMETMYERRTARIEEREAQEAQEIAKLNGTATAEARQAIPSQTPQPENKPTTEPSQRSTSPLPSPTALPEIPAEPTAIPPAGSAGALREGDPRRPRPPRAGPLPGQLSRRAPSISAARACAWR